jgi:hypothetical protein
MPTLIFQQTMCFMLDNPGLIHLGIGRSEADDSIRRRLPSWQERDEASTDGDRAAKAVEGEDADRTGRRC